MKDSVKAFCKIIPWLRESANEVLDTLPLLGEKIKIPVDDHTVTIYLHRAFKEHAPVLFELHGGGFVLGDARKEDELCELLKEKMNMHVVGIDYRKAPEYPYPAAIEDVLGVLLYFAKNADLFSMDETRFSLMGYSAGANLADVVAMKSKNVSEYQIKCQVLHYPFLDAVKSPYEKESHPADLPPDLMAAFNELYIPESERRIESDASPVYADKEQLKGMAPTLILTAKEDSLCKEGILYAEKLKVAGVVVRCQSMEHAHHGYIEDHYNQACFDTLPEENKEVMDPLFHEAAQMAMEETILWVKEYMGIR